MIKRRLDQDSGHLCDVTAACPAIFELEDGDFALIGTEVTELLLPHLPTGSGCASHERIVRVPKKVFEAAATKLVDLP